MRNLLSLFIKMLQIEQFKKKVDEMKEICWDCKKCNDWQ